MQGLVCARIPILYSLTLRNYNGNEKDAKPMFCAVNLHGAQFFFGQNQVKNMVCASPGTLCL